MIPYNQGSHINESQPKHISSEYGKKNSRPKRKNPSRTPANYNTGQIIQISQSCKDHNHKIFLKLTLNIRQYAEPQEEQLFSLSAFTFILHLRL